MKIIILHDYLTQLGGAEKVLICLLKIFPKAEIQTLIHDKKLFPKLNPKTSFIQALPFKKKYKIYIPLFPLAIKFLSPKKAEIILSSSHSYIKNIKKSNNDIHICYCYTPLRYAWHLKEEYLKAENPLLRPFISLFLSYLRYWDKKGSRNVNYFIAISNETKRRIKRYYNRNSIVIYPPVETNFFTPVKNPKRDYYLLVSRLIEYKKVDLAIKAFKKLNKKLIIVGIGRDEKKLRKLAKDSRNIIFKGRISDEELKKLYQNARAFINPQLEDFGITSVESQSCGTPVIAFAKGGALETVTEGRTGHFFYKQTPEALIKAVKEFEKMKFNPEDCRKNALKYDKEIFKQKIKSFVEEKYEEWKHKT